jgi:Peptidase A4 family
VGFTHRLCNAAYAYGNSRGKSRKRNEREDQMKTIRFSAYVALSTSLLIAAPQGFPQQSADFNSRGPVRFTVAPNTSSHIAMKTLPKATCMVYATSDSDVEHALKAFADDDGMIHFHVTPLAEAEQLAHFSVDCTAAHQSVTYDLELRPNSVPTDDMPAPVAEVRAPQATDVIRPALARADAIGLTGDELLKRGYPVRPDAGQAPTAYATWLRAVTRPSRKVNPRQVQRPEVEAGPATLTGLVYGPVNQGGPGTGSISTLVTTNNWSGFVLAAPYATYSPSVTYDLVDGRWNVPVVSPETNKRVYSNMWIGLDGWGASPYGDSDLWQAGTDSDDSEVVHGYRLTTYDAWTLFLPQGIGGVLPNFTVEPGDEIFSEVWVANLEKSPSLSGMYAIAYFENLTSGKNTFVYQCRGSVRDGQCTSDNQTQILGLSADWILERPKVNGQLPDLANYQFAYMYDAEALQSSGSWVYYNGFGIFNNQVMMYNGRDFLSGAYGDSATEIGFEWFNFH